MFYIRCVYVVTLAVPFVAVCFLFVSDGDHRDLHVLTHSFPTRRSSVLLWKSSRAKVDEALPPMDRSRRMRLLRAGRGSAQPGVAASRQPVDHPGRWPRLCRPGHRDGKGRTLSGLSAIERNRTGLIPRGRRSEERSVGKECVSPCGSRWSPSHYNNKTIKL